MTLRWRKDKRETGLRAVGAGPRASKLYQDGDTGDDYLACVNASGGGWRGEVEGWYWVVPTNTEKGLEYENTWNAILPTEKEAKDAAKKYVQEALAKNK